MQHTVPQPTPDTARHAGTHLRPYVKDEVQQVETIHAPHLILVQFKQIVDDTAVSAQIRRQGLEGSRALLRVRRCFCADAFEKGGHFRAEVQVLLSGQESFRCVESFRRPFDVRLYFLQDTRADESAIPVQQKVFGD